MPNSFHIEGLNALNEAQYATARDLFLQAIDNNPEVAESYLYLGKCYFFNDEKKHAISPLKKFIALRQNNSADVANVSYAFDLLGQCYEAENNDHAALTCYQTATRIYPAGASAWNNMGLYYIKSALHYLDSDLQNSAKLFMGALSFIKKALERSSNNPVFLQTAAGWYKQYIEVLERVVENTDAVQNNITSNYHQALQYYRKALSACHEQDSGLRNIILANLKECLTQYAQHLYINEEYKNAQEAYIELLQLDSKNLVAMNQIGMSLFKQERYPQARQYFSSILKVTGDSQELADAWLNIACTFRLEKEWERAEKSLKLAKKFAPNDPAITDEEQKLNESKPAAFSAYAPQTFFSDSIPESQGAGGQVVQGVGFHI